MRTEPNDEPASLIGPLTPEPWQAMRQLLQGYVSTQLLYFAASVGLPDLLGDGRRSCEDLARETSSDPLSFRRVLRGLIALGVVAADETGHVALTPLGASLQTDAPESLHGLTCIVGEEWYPAWGHFVHSVRTGEAAFERVFGRSLFDHYAHHPEASDRFNRRMVTATTETATAVGEAYDFSEIRKVVDVGGGHGALIATILCKNLHLRGVLFDLSAVAAAARKHIEAAGIGERCEIAEGDFFADVPAGADAYFLSQILHDWDDEQCVRILENCRRAMVSSGRVIVIETLMPQHITGPSFAVDQDLLMLVVTGGRERTEAEYRGLMARAGLRLARVVPTRASRGASVLEAVPVLGEFRDP